MLAFLALVGCSTIEPPTLHQRVVSTAVRDIGLHEREHRDILRYKIGVDPVRTQWCAAYVNSVLAKYEIPGSESVSENPLLARSFLDWGEPTIRPKRGDLVIFPRGSVSWQGHVGFYIREEVINGRLYYHILGGNQNDSVSLNLYLADRAIGIRTY